MVGFYSGEPIDSTAEQAEGTSILPAPTSAGLGAALTQGATEMPTVRLFNDANSSDETPANRGRVPDIGPGSQGFGQSAPAPSPMLDPASANKQYGLPGLSFTQPVSEDVASSLYDAKHAALVRQDIMNRTSGIVAGVGQTVAGLAPQFADPINLASAFVPGVGEARVASIVGEGLLARGIAGATQGALGQAALEPLNYLEDKAENTDWTMGQAMKDIAFGGLLGGGLHLALGHLGAPERLDEAAARTPAEPTAALDVPPTAEQLSNPIAARMEAAGPDARNMALKNSVSSLLDDYRPNNVSDLLELGATPDRTIPANELTGEPERPAVIPSEIADNPEALGAARQAVVETSGRMGIDMAPAEVDHAVALQAAGIEPEAAVNNAVKATQDATDRQATALGNLQMAMTRPDAPEDLTARTANGATVQAAPEIATSEPDAQLAAVQQEYEKHTARIAASGDEGAIAALAKVEEDAAPSEEHAKAFEAYSSCMGLRI